MSYTDHNSTRDHRAVEQIVSAAIRESIATTNINHLDEPHLADAICEALRVECDGDACRETDGVHEFWGEDCDGQTWRVHVHLS